MTWQPITVQNGPIQTAPRLGCLTFHGRMPESGGRLELCARRKTKLQIPSDRNTYQLPALQGGAHSRNCDGYDQVWAAHMSQMREAVRD